MIVALYANLKKKGAETIATMIIDFLKKKNVEIYAREDEANTLELPSLATIGNKKVDFLITIGGDGTILRLFHDLSHLDAPILGINLGHLGFMADVQRNEIQESLEDLILGKYKIEKRLMIEGRKGEKAIFAVNDIALHRGKVAYLVNLAIHIDGRYLTTFSADGVIIATPNGSTAYSLSAGGPILTPDLKAIVITPICPHTISNRPIVLYPESKIEIEYQSPYEPIEVTFDGFSPLSLSQGEKLTITSSPKTFNIVALSRIDYFTTLREKLGWSGQIPSRNDILLKQS